MSVIHLDQGSLIVSYLAVHDPDPGSKPRTHHTFWPKQIYLLFISDISNVLDILIYLRLFLSLLILQIIIDTFKI